MVEFCLLFGDMNTDFSRVSSGNKISLKLFTDKKHLNLDIQQQFPTSISLLLINNNNNKYFFIRTFWISPKVQLKYKYKT